MMNLGGPAKLEKVYDFLCRLFSDREIIKLPFQKLAGPLLAKRRTPHVQEQYAAIGGGSPIRKWTDAQGEAMCKLLDQLSPDTAPHKHYIAFRYADPLTPDTLASMHRDGVTRAVAFTQYPQYSCTTTGSSLNELYRQIQAISKNDEISSNSAEKSPNSGSIQWSLIDRWSGDERLAKAFAKLIREELEAYPEEKRSKVVLVFSAHSIPHRVVDTGDTYPAEVANTVHRVMDQLGYENPYRLVWQSKVGPLPWLGPKTWESLEGFSKVGQKDAILIPIAFTSDHIETLYELDQTYMKDANEKLGMNVRRCKALNTEPLFIESLAHLVHNHLKSGKVSSNQYPVRCPRCTNEDCQRARDFFLGNAGNASL
jgi:ferrochelatase